MLLQFFKFIFLSTSFMSIQFLLYQGMLSFSLKMCCLNFYVQLEYRKKTQDHSKQKVWCQNNFSKAKNNNTSLLTLSLMMSSGRPPGPRRLPPSLDRFISLAALIIISRRLSSSSRRIKLSLSWGDGIPTWPCRLECKIKHMLSKSKILFGKE